MFKKVNIMALLFLLFVSCTQQSEQAKNNAEDIILKTDDGIGIKGTFYRGDKEMPSVVLLHMLNGKRQDWTLPANILNSQGYNVIAIDFRGHGESSLKWQGFSEKDFNNMVIDVKAARDFLFKNNRGNRIGIIGASIGANIALNYAITDKDVKTIILLSPGLNYRGVDIEDSIRQYKNKILIIASEEDKYSFQSANNLKGLAQNAELKIYNGAEHGTRLFGKTDIDIVMVEWLKSNI